MNKDQLFDAIGGIDEGFLAEAQMKAKRSTGTLRRVLLAAAIIGALAVTAMAASGLFSRPVEDGDIVTGETVFPFYMDEKGNIITEGAAGLKVRMDVTVNADAPEYLEEFYVLDMSEEWKIAGGGSAGDGYVWHSNGFEWAKGDLPGKVRLWQDAVSYYTVGTYGENVVDTLPKLDERDGVTSEITEFAGISVLKVTIPKLTRFVGDPNINAYYCVEGETRLYWTDGDYILMFAWPAWMPDSEAEQLMRSIEKEAFVDSRPADFGKIDPAGIARRLPDFSVAPETGTTCANNTMGLGRFTYSDGYIYCAGDGYIYRYDLQTGDTEEIVLADKYAGPGEMFATENYICYLDTWSDLKVLPKKGGEEGYIYQGIHSPRLYAEDTILYSSNGVMDLQTGQITQWPKGTIGYYVDDQYVYTIRDEVQGFFRAKKGTMNFEEVSLSFQPISILSHDGAVYMTQGGVYKPWDVICYQDGEETVLPVKALEFQIFDGLLIYRCEEEGGMVIKTYDLHSGKTEVLCEEGFNFSILEQRYVCVLCADENGQAYATIIDWQTGERACVDVSK